jgi:hypothetical protein
MAFKPSLSPANVMELAMHMIAIIMNFFISIN